MPIAASLGTDFVDAFRFMPHNLGLLGSQTVNSALLSAASLGVAIVVALPVAVWLGHLRRGSLLAINGANMGRALPELGLIAIFMAVLGLGFLNVMVAIAIVAIPPILTNGYTAVAGVDDDVVDAARGMGMRPLQILFKVELPLALPLMFAGIRTSALFAVGASPLAAFAGGTGLGIIIVNQADYGIGGVLAAALWVAALALLIQGLLALVARALTPGGLRESEVNMTIAMTGGPGPAQAVPADA